MSHLQANGHYSVQAVFGVAILECVDCRFLFADFIHPQVIDYFYKNLCRKGTDDEEFSGLRENAAKSGRSQLKTIKPYLPRAIGRVLDFGGGVGETARLFLPMAEEVYITESDPHCLPYIKEEPRLIHIDGDDLLSEKYIGFFDFIIFSNVLEHMTYPIRRMQEFSRLLTEGGQLFVEVPNEDPFLRQAGTHCQQHISFFSPETFRKLVKKQGSFDIEELRTCGPKVEDMVATGKLAHDFDAQKTSNGWVIRAILKNSKPKTDIIDTNLQIGDADEILARMSQMIFNIAHTYN